MFSAILISPNHLPIWVTDGWVTHKSAKEACLEAAHYLRMAADRFEILAETEYPTSEETYIKVNSEELAGAR